MLLFTTLNIPAEFEMGSSCFFRIFVPGMDTVLMAVPQLVSSRVFVQVKVGEFAFQFRAYTSMQVITSMQVLELPMTFTSQLTVRVGSRIRTPPTKYKSGSNRWQHGALCEQDGLRKTLPVKLAVVSVDLLCVFLVRCNQIRDTTVVTGLKDASDTIRRYAYIK